ncbi:hypothetical protein BKA83DRAFT_2708339 [Pisolithus microcarpus]|nr:hypothetical protein BKA83DRAFT_2708339 [Pisolithus microcarpus]
MSDPYVYTPPAFQPTQYLHYSPYAPHSPFIPPHAAFPPSPHHPPSPYLPSTTPYSPPFPELPPESAYWPPRPRRPSWHAGQPPSPYIQPFDSPYHSRRRSFGTPQWGDSQFLPWAYPCQGPSPRFEVHPLLNGEVPYSGLSFNLASPTFAPMRYIGPGQFAIVSQEELSYPATNPPITRMRITHDAIPDWPVDLELRYEEYPIPAGPPPPITLGDVLYMIHSSLHRQITHQDWGKLSDSEQNAVARAYTRRYKNIPSTADAEACLGVKKVDYLRERYMFKGLIKAPDENGFFCWKMIT